MQFEVLFKPLLYDIRDYQNLEKVFLNSNHK